MIWQSQRGFIKLPVLMAAVFGLGLGASMYLNYAQHQRSEQDRKLMQGQITDLRYQVEQDKLASGGSSSPSPSAGPNSSPSPSNDPSPSPSTAVLDASAQAQTATVLTPGNIHQGPSKSSAVLLPYARVPKGATVTLGGTVAAGYQQITINGVTGYIQASYLQY